MTALDVAALIGAAAWLPQIATWAYRALARPRVRVIPDKQSQIGFTSLGPIFNLRMAVSTEQKDTIIDGIYVTLKHESGAAHRMDWAGITETFSEIIGPSGIRQTMQRDAPAIAMRLSTNSLQDKMVRLQEQKFHDERLPLENAVYTKLNYLFPNSADPFAETLGSSEVHEFVEFHKRAFWWKAGVYRVSFGVSSPDKVRIPNEEYTFALTQADIDALSSNIGLVRRNLELLMKTERGVIDEHRTSWNWRTVTLRRSSPLVRHTH